MKLMAMSTVLLGLLVLSSGCATSRPAFLPGSSSKSEFGESQSTLRPGENVKVRLNSGEIRRGNVLCASQSGIVLANASDRAAREDTIAATTIASIESVRKGFGVRDALVAVVVAVVATVGVLASSDFGLN